MSTEFQRFLAVPLKIAGRRPAYFPIIQKFKEANLLEIYPWYAALAKRALRPQYIDQMNLTILHLQCTT